MTDAQAVDQLDSLDDHSQGFRASLSAFTTNDIAAAALVVVAMSVVATWGFNAIFSSSTFLAVSLAGAALGALVVVVGRRFGLWVGEIVGLAVIAPMVAGPLAAGGIGFYRGLVYGWADILSATPPVDPTPELKALPFIAAFLGAFVGTELFRLRALPGVGVLGPILTLVVAALFSEQTRPGAIGVGLALLVGMLVLVRLHYASVSNTGLLVLALVVALVSTAASAASIALPYADEERRFDLRDLQTPPWDPLAIPSPLTEIKADLVGLDADEVPILRVRGDQPVNRWRSASLPAFNGTYWSVAEPERIAEFVAVDTFLPDIGGEQAQGESLTFDVDVLAPIGHWVPVAGVPERVDFDDVTDARMSLETGTLGIPTQLQPGNAYELTVSPFVELSDEALGAQQFVADDGAIELELLPALVRNLAADFSTGLDQLSGERVIAIRDNLRLGSYDLSTTPGHAFGRIADFLQVVQFDGTRTESDLRPLVAYEELYVASAGLLTRLSDIPVRVAVGYVIPDERWRDRSAEIFASDANAWIEVYVEDQGWMPIDVTPDRTREPEEIEQNSERQGVPVADPPKPPELPDEVEPPEVETPDDEDAADEEEEEEDEEVEQPARQLTVVRALVGAASAGLAAIVALALAVATYKAWRRRRRRGAEQPAARIAGAWAELIDRVDEAGGGLPAAATPAEAAMYARSVAGLSDPQEAARVGSLADQVSVAAFHPSPPTSDNAEVAWQTYDELVASLRSEASPLDRVRRAVDPRTLPDDALTGSR